MEKIMENLSRVCIEFKVSLGPRYGAKSLTCLKTLTLLCRTEPHDSNTSTAAKDPGTASKEQPRHQELSFGARRRSLHPWVSVPLDSPSSASS
ncbi:hypothetical protein AgCh_030280 [Apium graveolens]